MAGELADHHQPHDSSLGLVGSELPGTRLEPPYATGDVGFSRRRASGHRSVLWNADLRLRDAARELHVHPAARRANRRDESEDSLECVFETSASPPADGSHTTPNDLKLRDMDARDASDSGYYKTPQ